MRSSIVIVAFAAGWLGVSCGDDKPSVSPVTNAAPAPPATSKPVPLTEAADTGLIVTGPIIVEHQVEVTAQTGRGVE